MLEERVSWVEAEPRQLEREKEAMAAIAPELVWRDSDPAGGWEGPVPLWPFERPQPPGLHEFVTDRRLRVVVEYSQAHPMVEPKFWPVDPEPNPIHRTQHIWHLNGDGSLCLLRLATDWDGSGTAADLVPKASGWFLEYLLMEAGVVTEMSSDGIASDDSCDHLFKGTARPDEP